jgi:hypothetical protein
VDKRYQFFVSSTFLDLKEERKAVMQALLAHEHFPAGMELFPASDDDQLTLIKGVIDDSDYYSLVVGSRYGSTAETGISFTEMEFNYAVLRGIPVLAFLHENPENRTIKQSDGSDALRDKLNAFRAKVQKGRHVKFWTDASDLQIKVFQAVSAETKRNPRTGWVRADPSLDPKRLNELLA